MAKMPRFSRWMVNRRNARRSTRYLQTLGPHLGLGAQSRLLELGAGAGGLSALLHERYRPARLVVTDVDPDQLGEARANLERRWGSLPSTVGLEVADARSLTFGDGSFDAVFAMEVLHHVEVRHHDYAQRPAALREIRRVLAPGGHLVFSEFSRVPEVERTLGELGFTPEFEERRRRRTVLAIYRSPSTGEPAPSRKS